MTAATTPRARTKGPAQPTPARAPSDRERAAQAAVERVSEDAEATAEVDMHDDRTRENKTTGFARMRTDWHGPDRDVVAQVLGVAQDRVATEFIDALQVMSDLFLLVRDPEVTEDGEVLLDRFGFPVWARDVDGRYVEDWSRLGIKDRDTFLFQITTRLVDWEQRAADAWGEAMFAKAQWEEAFATSFVEPGEGARRTDEGLTQHARQSSREERYFAIFVSLYSRKASELVKSMERLGQRLKDTMP